MEEKKRKQEEEFGAGVKVEADSMTSNEKIVVCLYAASAISAFLAIYRSIVLAMVFSIANTVTQCNHIAAVGVFALMSAWFAFYGKHRSSGADRSSIQLYNSFSIMKFLSFLAGVFCILRMITTALYFLHKESVNGLTAIYVVVELVLWLVLAVFFFMFWKSRRNRIKQLREDDFNARLKM